MAKAQTNGLKESDFANFTDQQLSDFVTKFTQTDSISDINKRFFAIKPRIDTAEKTIEALIAKGKNDLIEKELSNCSRDEKSTQASLQLKSLENRVAQLEGVIVKLIETIKQANPKYDEKFSASLFGSTAASPAFSTPSLKKNCCPIMKR